MALCHAGFDPEWVEDLDLISFWALIHMQLKHEAGLELRDIHRLMVAFHGDKDAFKKWQAPLLRVLEGEDYDPAKDPETGQSAFLKRFGGGF